MDVPAGRLRGGGPTARSAPRRRRSSARCSRRTDPCSTSAVAAGGPPWRSSLRRRASSASTRAPTCCAELERSAARARRDRGDPRGSVARGRRPHAPGRPRRLPPRRLQRARHRAVPRRADRARRAGGRGRADVRAPAIRLERGLATVLGPRPAVRTDRRRPGGRGARAGLAAGGLALPAPAGRGAVRGPGPGRPLDAAPALPARRTGPTTSPPSSGTTRWHGPTRWSRCGGPATTLTDREPDRREPRGRWRAVESFRALSRLDGTFPPAVAYVRRQRSRVVGPGGQRWFVGH